MKQPSQDAICYGADQVLAIDNPALQDPQADLQLEAQTRISQRSNSDIILLASTTTGRDLGPRIAVRLNVGLAQDCLHLRIDPQLKRLIARRPVYGGNAIAEVMCTETPQMVSIRPKVYEPLEYAPSRTGEILIDSVELDPSIDVVKLVEVIQDEKEGARLEDSRVVIAGGRGLGSSESFKHLEIVAQLLTAGLGASRAVVDAGWVPPHMQIGLTGKTISPDLYIAVGISGASQHMAGCSGAKAIVAINKDQNANIFNESLYGVVGDWEKILPSFTETLRELLE